MTAGLSRTGPRSNLSYRACQSVSRSAKVAASWEAKQATRLRIPPGHCGPTLRASSLRSNQQICGVLSARASTDAGPYHQFCAARSRGTAFEHRFPFSAPPRPRRICRSRHVVLASGEGWGRRTFAWSRTHTDPVCRLITDHYRSHGPAGCQRRARDVRGMITDRGPWQFYALNQLTFAVLGLKNDITL